MTNAVNQLLDQPSRQEQCLAGTVLVLTEIAHADKSFDGAERDTIVSTLAELFDAENSRVDALLAAAIEARMTGMDLAHLARILQQKLNQRDRHDVVAAMWKVVLADGTVDQMEQRLADSMSTLLGVTYSQVAEIRKAL